MIRNYRARIVWIGRRALDGAIQSKLDRLAQLGPAPCYLTADATDRASLERAFAEIKRDYGQVHGLVHSAIVLQGGSLAKMEESSFRAALAAKVDVSVRLAQVFEGEPMDFVLFFSSMQSFSKIAGQSNYAAGCTFADAFAHQLRRTWPCAVKIMNWGYWGSIGVVATKDYQARMARVGVGSIEAEEGMTALEVLLGAALDQVVFVKTTKPLTEEDGVMAELLCSYEPGRPSIIAKLHGDERNSIAAE